MSTRAQQQRGVALLVALLVVALAVILVAALLDRGELALARTRNVLRGEQAQAYAQGLEIYAAQILLTTQRQGPDTNSSPWALPLPTQPVPGGVIGASMHDMNGCFNLNNLGSVGGNPGLWAPVFANLLKARGLVDPGLPTALVDWLSNAQSAPLDNYYLAQPVAYRAAHRAFVHVSELRLVRGFDSDVYARIAPYVCALPAGTLINVNTASVPVLQSLSSGISQAVAENLWQNGAAQWTTATFKDQLVQLNVPADATLDALISDTSTYFLAQGDIVLDDVPFTFRSVIERAQEQIAVIERSRGGDDALVVPALVDAASAPE